MRAIYLKDKDFKEGDQLNVEGDVAKHLTKVARIKLEERVLALNGRGAKALTKVSLLLKKEVVLQVEKIEKMKKSFFLDLAICTPKKDAFEQILKNSTEIGFSKIIPVRSKFSQLEYVATERYEKIVESALIQSNNCFIPEIHHQLDFVALSELAQKYDQVVYFSSRDLETGSLEKVEGKILMIVGPEGGLSIGEEEFLVKDIKNLTSLHLPTPILRAPNAVSVGAGLILSKII